jgi:hypothetical protein
MSHYPNAGPFGGNDRPGSAEKGDRPGMMTSDEWAKKQRELMIQQREIMLNQPSRAWSEKPGDARDNMMQQPRQYGDQGHPSPSHNGSNMMQKNPFIVNFEPPPHMKMPGMGGGGCPFMNNGSPRANSKSMSPMNYSHPFGVVDEPDHSYPGAGDRRQKQQNERRGW